MDTKVIPLFPLNLVLFPGIPLPLHIFEERYKEMIRHCMEKNLDFGVVLYDNEQLSEIGCSANIREILQEYDDGRMDILTEGVDRFRIERVIEDQAYLQAEVKYLPHSETTKVAENLQEDALNLLKKILKYAHPSLDASQFNRLEAESLSFMIAASSGFTLGDKQRLLELNDVKQRLAKIMSDRVAILERARIHLLMKNARFMEGNFSMN